MKAQVEQENRLNTEGSDRLAHTLVINCGRAFAQAVDEQDLLQSVCNTLVNNCGFRLAWFGYTEPGTSNFIRLVAQAGDLDGFLKETSWALRLRQLWPDALPHPALRGDPGNTDHTALDHPSQVTTRRPLLIHEPCNEPDFRSRPGGIGQGDLSIDVTREENAMLRARCGDRTLSQISESQRQQGEGTGGGKAGLIGREMIAYGNCGERGR